MCMCRNSLCETCHQHLVKQIEKSVFFSSSFGTPYHHSLLPSLIGSLSAFQTTLKLCQWDPLAPVLKLFPSEKGASYQVSVDQVLSRSTNLEFFHLHQPQSHRLTWQICLFGLYDNSFLWWLYVMMSSLLLSLFRIINIWRLSCH